jgi:heparan-alpha-glucosaminide N-acetyltransferase
LIVESVAISAHSSMTSAACRQYDSRASKRVASIDIFRGLNILLMIFVNNLDEVKGLPWWTYHRGDVNGMTYVDMVFPGFLFLMGMSIPMALESRLAGGESKGKIWGHVVVRTLSLLALGLFIANARHVDLAHTHLSQELWTTLGLLAIVMAWMRFPGEERRKIMYRTIRYAGLAIMAVLFVIFRRIAPDGTVSGLDFSYWEILGLLGWAYLLVSGIYLLVGKRFKILTAAFVVLISLNVFSTMGWLNWTNAWPLPWNPFSAGLSAMTMAGVMASLVIVGDTVAASFHQKSLWILASAAVLLTIGFALQPLGISKNRSTPAWCLYCTAANLLIALLLLWVVDVKNWRAWANFAKPVGQNPLLPYILAYVPLLLLQLHWLNTIGTAGSWGVLKSVLLTGLMLAISTLFLRFGLKLRV